MNEQRAIDAVIVGAGPAGLATAIELSKRGLRVTVIDRAGPEIDKPCGEGLMPDGVLQLDRLGVELPTDQRALFRGIRYLDDERRAEARFPRGVGIGVRRPILHRAMTERATECGVEIRWNTKAMGLRVDGVETSNGPILAEWVIGADGLRSRIRHWAGLSASSRQTPRFGIRRHYQHAPWTDLVEVYWADSCEAYVTPVSSEAVGVAILWSGSKAGFDEHLARFPALAAKLVGAEQASRDLGTGPLDQRAKAVSRGRLALVGDAAGYRDAITGEGISVALHQASALAAAIAAGDMVGYRRAVRRQTLLPFALIRGLLIAERRPRLRRRLIDTLARDPGLFTRLLAIHARQRPARDLGAAGVVRLARGLLTH